MTKLLLVFGGCYSNLEATRAVIGIAARLGFDPCDVVCTGDVVAYCADSQATVDLIRASGIRVVMGNCEEALAAAADNCGCGFEEGSTCDQLSVQWHTFAAARLDEDARKWMQGLPQHLEINMCDRRLVVIHGGGKQINRFIFQFSIHTGLGQTGRSRVVEMRRRHCRPLWIAVHAALR